MKHFTNKALTLLFVTVTLLVCLAFTAAGAANKVVYISADGTGDGTSPDKPLGNIEDYVTAEGSEPGNAFYRGLEKLRATGGTIVVVGDVFIDSAHSRIPASKSDRKVPSEFEVPSVKSGCSITVTSVHGDVDYRKQGAKFVLDHDKCNTAILVFSFPVTFTDIDMEYRYDPSSPNLWNVPFIIGGGGKALVIDEGVTVTSYNTLKKTDGDVYPILMGGTRYSILMSNTNLTVKSGTWSMAIAGSFGMVDNTPDRGTVDGNATLLIEGGKIGTVVGTGSLRNPSGSVKGSLNITVKDGDIDELYLTNDRAFKGKEVNLIIEKDASIKKFFFTPSQYKGDMTEFIQKIRITNRSSLTITPPQNAPAIPEVPETDEPSNTPLFPNVEPETEPPLVKVPIPEDNRPLKQKLQEDFIHPKVLMITVAVCLLIALGFGIRYIFKKTVIK